MYGPKYSSGSIWFVTGTANLTGNESYQKTLLFFNVLAKPGKRSAISLLGPRVHLRKAEERLA